MHRILIPADATPPLHPGDRITNRTWWRARWLRLPHPIPVVAGFRLRLVCEQTVALRLHVSADERFRLWVDGADLCVGPERGDPDHWRFESWDLELSAGVHWFAAEVWALGERAPYNQVGCAPGFIVSADEPWHDHLATGIASWEMMRFDAYSFEDQPSGGLIGPRAIIQADRLPDGWQTGGGSGFAPATVGNFGHALGSDAGPGSQLNEPMLVASRLPPQVREPLANGIAVLLDARSACDDQFPLLDPARDLTAERPNWQAWLDGRGPVVLPVGASRRCLVDLGRYRSCWPALTAAGSGGSVRLRFAEGCYLSADTSVGWNAAKGNRSEWQGRFLRGFGPVFRTAAGEPRRLLPLDWECGRWLEITVTAGSEPLRLERLELTATGYPFADEATFTSDDPRLERLRDLCLHTLRVGTHETYCDCPHFERMQYVGDTRLEVLVTYVLQRDDRLPRQALEAFAGARLDDGLLPSRHPARGTQIIAPFALWWVEMLHDFAWWRDDPAFVARLLPTARGVLDVWWSWRNHDGLIEAPRGWNFVDWVPGWPDGMPVGADRGVSAILNWQCVGTLERLAELEDAHGEPELAALHRRRSSSIAAALECCWDAARGRWRDAPGQDGSSEHVQCLALLSGRLAGERAQRTGVSLARDADLARTTIYFSHYLFQALHRIRRGDVIWPRLDLWFGLEAQGFTTTPESPEPSRSDCQPWGAHPLYHLTATLAGVSPAVPGFRRIRVDPLASVGPTWFQITVPHPQGIIRVERDGAQIRITAPAGVPVERPDGSIVGADGVFTLVG